MIDFHLLLNASSDVHKDIPYNNNESLDGISLFFSTVNNDRPWLDEKR